MMKAFHFLNWNLWVKSKVQEEKQESENGQLRKKPKSAEHNKSSISDKVKNESVSPQSETSTGYSDDKEDNSPEKDVKVTQDLKVKDQKSNQNKVRKWSAAAPGKSGTFLRKKSRENESSRNLCISLKGYSSCLKKFNEPIFNVSQEEW